MIFLQKEMIESMKGIIYFKDEQGIYATLNTYSNLYSFMEDLSQDARDLFNDLANDTKEEENVFIYYVKEELKVHVYDFLLKYFTKTNRYDWIEETE